MENKTLLFLIAFFIFFGATVSATTKIYVDPPAIINQGYNVGDTFSVNIKLDDVSDLAGFQFKLYWNPSVLAFDHDVLGNIWSQYFLWKRENNNQEGYYYNLFTKKSSPSFNGNGVLAQIYFKVINPGMSPLDLRDTKLSDSNALAITHEVKDGVFSTSPCNSDGTLPNGICYEACGADIECNKLTPNTKWCADYVTSKNCSSTCQYSETICRTDAYDSDGTDNKTAGNCTEYQGCSAGNCISNTPYEDTCIDVNTLIEYYNSGSSCLSINKNCKDYGPFNICSKGKCEICADVNNATNPDNITNMRDINAMILCFNSHGGSSPSSNWDYPCKTTDVNNDNVVNMRDINIAILQFNRRCYRGWMDYREVF